jgi:hypothetical protein
MDAVEKELEILLSEKEQADKQIGSYMDLQLKVHTVIFTAAAVAAGWIFTQSKDGRPPSLEVRGAAALTLAYLGSFAVLQGTITYGIVLGYIRYKHLVVGRRMQELLKLPKNPLVAMQTISSSLSNRMVVASSFFGGTFILVGSGGLLGYVLWLWLGNQISGSLFSGGLLACAVLWLCSVTCGLGLAWSMFELQREIGDARGSANPGRSNGRKPPKARFRRSST